MLNRLGLVVIVSFALRGAFVLAEQPDLKLASLPQAVRVAVQGETQGASIKGVSKERENGKTPLFDPDEGTIQPQPRKAWMPEAPGLRFNGAPRWDKPRGLRSVAGSVP